MPTVAEAMQTGIRLQQAGRLPEAERIYLQVLQLYPHQPDALHLLGVAATQSGRHEEGVRRIREAVAQRPAEPLFRCSLANALTTSGQFDAALAECQEVLRLRPDYAEAHVSLGNLFRSTGRLAEAEAAFREVIRLQPGHADGHNNLANTLRSQGQLTQAEASYREALRLRPADAITLANLGAVLLDQGRLDEAERCLRPAVALRPDLGPAHSSLGRLLRFRGQLIEAEASLREALRFGPPDPEVYTCLGDVLRDREDIPAARAAFAEAVRLQPAAFEARNNLAACLIEEGDTAEAVSQLQEVLRLRPGYVPALGNLGTLARDGHYQFREGDIAQVRAQLADRRLAEENRCTLSFTLANVLDRQKAFDEAFACFQQGNDIKAAWFEARGQGFDRAAHLRFVEQTIALSVPEFFQRGESLGNASPVPLFIVGMPRSGTTLVEQILASHSQVVGAGELPDIPNIGRRLAEAVGHSDGYPNCLSRADRATVQAAAAEYLTRLTRLSRGAARVIDKLPANSFHLPLIRLLFPRAFIIHCRRNAFDVCLSCFMQDFHTLSFATRLEDIGFYYQTYELVAKHWRGVDPGPLLEVHYEDLVFRPEPECRRLLAFCGLDWEDRCLRFHENRRTVRTASVTQVRQPLYRTAVGRWQNYRRHLGPLLEALGRSPAEEPE